jgi:hypothetical protein
MFNYHLYEKLKREKEEQEKEVKKEEKRKLERKGKVLLLLLQIITRKK